MQIEKKRLADMKPADYNPRKISGDDFEKLKRSIEEFGYVEPLIWNKTTGNIVGGHQRYKALNELGYEEVETVIIEADETKEKEINVGLNKITGEWNIEQLKDVLLEIDTGLVDPELSGFSLGEIEDMMTATYQEFNNAELDEGDFDDDDFDCRCPECGFHFNAK